MFRLMGIIQKKNKVNYAGDKGEICRSQVLDLIRWDRRQDIGGRIEGLIDL